MTKTQLEAMMLPQINDIVRTWNKHGIIIETQFQFAFQHMFKTSSTTAYKIIVEHGGYAVEDTDDENSGEFHAPICTAIEIADEGWMYAFFDPNRLTHSQASTLIKKYFATQR